MHVHKPVSPILFYSCLCFFSVSAYLCVVRICMLMYIGLYVCQRRIQREGGGAKGPWPPKPLDYYVT